MREEVKDALSKYDSMIKDRVTKHKEMVAKMEQQKQIEAIVNQRLESMLLKLRNSFVAPCNDASKVAKSLELSDGTIHQDHLLNYSRRISTALVLSQVIDCIDQVRKELK